MKVNEGELCVLGLCVGLAELCGFDDRLLYSCQLMHSSLLKRIRDIFSISSFFKQVSSFHYHYSCILGLYLWWFVWYKLTVYVAKMGRLLFIFGWLDQMVSRPVFEARNSIQRRGQD